jgi:hypothetical protein
MENIAPPIDGAMVEQFTGEGVPMQKKRSKLQERKSEYLPEREGAQCAGAVQISIRYRTMRDTHTYGKYEEVYPGPIVSYEKGGDIVFCEHVSHPLDHPHEDVGHTISSETVELDAYKVRADFENATTEQEIRQFLNSAGTFWPFGRVTQSEFCEWQDFVKLIRRDDFDRLCLTDTKAYNAARVLDNFNIDENPWFSGAWKKREEEIEEDLRRGLDRMPESFRQDFEKTTRHRESATKHRRDLFDYFANPPAYAWMRYTPEAIKSFENGERTPERTAPLSTDLMPVLVFKPTNALEAIAATIAADRLKGTRHRVCEGCNSLFMRTKLSHKYCGGASCKDNARAKRRKDNDHKARDFYIGKRLSGLDTEAVLSLPESPNYKITPRVIERAEKALAKKKHSPAR